MITKKDGKIKEYTVKFEDGSTKTFDEGILITGSHVKQDDDKIGFGVIILSAIRSGHTEYYCKAVKVLQDELKEQLQDELKEQLEEREKKLKEIQKVKAKVAEEIANDMYEKTKKKMEKKFGIKIDDTLEKILKEKTIELVNHKMDKDILEKIGIDFDDM